jgi:hypothetical protein
MEMAGEKRFAYWAFGLSFIVHLVFFGAFVALGNISFLLSFIIVNVGIFLLNQS